VNTVSVIIPSYNAGSYLRAAVESVLAQTRKAAQVIVVNDGSTDGSVDAIADLPVTRLDTGGKALAAGARNAGLRIATGDEIAFLDADDLWDPDHLAGLLDLAERFPASDLFYSRIRRIGNYPGDAEAWGPDATPWNPTIALIQANRIQPSATMIRRTALDRVGTFNAAYPGVEDLDLWLRLARGASFVGTLKVTASYRVHPGQTIAQKPRMRQSLWGALTAFANQAAEGAGEIPRAAILAALRRRYRYDLYWAWREGDAASLRLLAEAAATLGLGASAAWRTGMARMSVPPMNLVRGLRARFSRADQVTPR
jgi:glycosyltransferase involved in cell wall biosynthesis